MEEVDIISRIGIGYNPKRITRKTIGNKTNFSLMQHHKYSYTDLENMLPWERQLYVTLLVQYVEEENDKRKQ